MRAFIGIKVPENEKLTKAIAGFKKINGLKTVEPTKLHITIKFLGEINEKQADSMSSSIEGIKGFGKFIVKVKGTKTFPDEKNPKVIWAGAESEKIKEINGLVENYAEKIGIQREKKAFTPHITLARAKTQEQIDLKRLLTNDEFFEFEANELSLIKSELTPEGAKYSNIKTVKL